MSGDDKGTKGLERVFSKYADLLSEQNANVNKRIDHLASATSDMAKEMGNLIGIIGKSEERHNSHTESLSRIEKNQVSLGKDLKHYKQNNDDRVMDIEKQVLLLDKSSGESKEYQKDKRKMKSGILIAAGGTLLAALIFYIVTNIVFGG